MMKRLYIYLFLLFLIMMVSLSIKMNSIPTITFFPIDYNEGFESTQTNLDLNEDKNTISWRSFSKSKDPLYLRQDISLLYANGQLKGVLNKWDENTNVIQLNRNILMQKDSFLQAISYHHGEIHHNSEQINSIHRMSTDYLYVVKSPHSTFTSFKKSNESFDVTWKQLLDDVSEQRLQKKWSEWINHHNIKKNNYTVLPLYELHQLNKNNLPQLDESQTDKVIGQLWEGLYKNYVIPIMENNNNNFPKSFMPIVLFDKKNTHLLVLFNIDDENKILLQKY